MQDNVYTEAKDPTVMFDSVARDFSHLGAQFGIDVMDAMNRKGGDLIQPKDLESDEYAKKRN